MNSPLYIIGRMNTCDYKEWKEPSYLDFNIVYSTVTIFWVFFSGNYGTVVDGAENEADRIIMINRPQVAEYCGNKIR